MENKESFEREYQPEKIKIYAIFYVWPYALVVATIMFFATKMKWDWPFYFALGTVTSVFGFSIMMKAARVTKPEYWKNKMIMNYIIRYLLYIVVMSFAFLQDELMVLPVGIGLLSMRMAILVSSIIHRGKKV